jgi:N-acetylglucosaminyldiphosphoundecaprenol N-acetyl-beta-D-mannosaminyltransferase
VEVRAKEGGCPITYADWHCFTRTMWGIGFKADAELIPDFPDVLLELETKPGRKIDPYIAEPLQPPVIVLGVPFVHQTLSETVEDLEKMVATRKPHYIVTANVDFIVQSLEDEELRRIFLEADRVVCDGTPLIWASRILGNPLPERVAGADLVPLLLQLSARKGYRIFFLGGEPAVAKRAIENVELAYPGVKVCGHYSPPFKPLLEMDHDEIFRRVRAAQPDFLLVSFGCPKAEKWISMHYRQLGVPVSIGVGGTIDFLAGRVKRAPQWMQRSGLEWVYRLVQEPRRLYRRYGTDLKNFGHAFAWQHFLMKKRAKTGAPEAGTAALLIEPTWRRILPPAVFDRASILRDEQLWRESRGTHCLLETSHIENIDSTAMGLLVLLHKTLTRRGLFLILIRPSHHLMRVLRLMHLEHYFLMAEDTHEARELILNRNAESQLHYKPDLFHPTFPLMWRGEITAANAEEVWQQIETDLENMAGWESLVPIDLSEVRFMDSAGIGLLAKARKHSQKLGMSLQFMEVSPAVRNVLRISKMESLLEENE